MTANLDIDRHVATWLDAAWPSDLAPDVVDAALHEARFVDRPSRLVRLATGPAAWPATRELIVLGRRRSFVQVLAVVALVVALLSASVLAGSRLVKPPRVPFRGILSPAVSELGAWFWREPHPALLPDGRVAVQADDATLYAFDPSTRTFSRLGTTTARRVGSWLFAMPDGRLAILGGDTRPADQAVMASTLEMFDLQRGSTTNQIPMRIPRAFERALPLQDGRILAVGGTSLDQENPDQPVDTIEIFDPVQGSWSVKGSITGFVTTPSLIELADGRVLITNVFGPNVAVFDPSTDRLSTLPGRASLTATAVVLADGRVLLTEHACEGRLMPPGSPDLDATPTLFFDPEADSFSPGPQSPHCAWTATVLAGGEVLYTGWSSQALTQQDYDHQENGRTLWWAGLLDPTTGKLRTVNGVEGYELDAVALPDGRAVIMVNKDTPTNLGGGVAQVLE